MRSLVLGLALVPMLALSAEASGRVPTPEAVIQRLSVYFGGSRGSARFEGTLKNGKVCVVEGDENVATVGNTSPGLDADLSMDIVVYGDRSKSEKLAEFHIVTYHGFDDMGASEVTGINARTPGQYAVGVRNYWDYSPRPADEYHTVRLSIGARNRVTEATVDRVTCGNLRRL